MYKLFIGGLILSCIFILNGCSNGNTETSNEVTDIYEIVDYKVYVPSSAYTLTKQTLTVLLFNHMVQEIGPTVNRFTSRMRESGLDVDVNFIEIISGDFENARMRLHTSMMAGNPPDLFIVVDLPLLSYASMGMIADMWDLIDNDPSFCRSYLYKNVLEAFEINGKLVAMPMLFTVPLVGVNALLPESIIERFSEYSYITITEISSIYTDLLHYYPDFNHLVMLDTSTTESLVLFELSNHIDFANMELNFDRASFSLFLESSRYAFGGLSALATTMPPETFQELLSGRVAFSMKQYSLNQALALLETNPSFFVNHIPLASDDGRFIIHNTWSGGFEHDASTFAVAAGGNQKLAWEFMKELMSYFAFYMPTDHFGMSTLSTPIYRPFFQYRTESILRNILTRRMRVPAGNIVVVIPEREATTAAADAAKKLAEINEQTMVIPPFIPSRLFMEDVEMFMYGLITADEAAQRVYNRLTIWILEQQ